MSEINNKNNIFYKKTPISQYKHTCFYESSLFDYLGSSRIKKNRVF